ncbi:DNA polymerase [Acetatifactor muris]|uniref:DNA-directed DNA polymerase n=1 Tax=Acetatifactor muris TaxID=879566 RepID=A0A2K4ZFJ0_9FIRM|nr:DNA polymerase [Acetatifactor muris]MCR2047767.1 DNA polymerase [Acetatifactor muris]SOY29224.1 DNA polymerase I, thermostable [Acetatifactor muris]
MERVLSADIETFSDVDLIKCGVYAYADSPAFEILLFAYSFDGGETQIIDLAQGEKLPAEVEEAIFDVSVTKTAYNANFERTCLSKYFGRYIPPESWHCSAVQAAMLALPRSLEDVGRVLGLDEQKMKEGKELIRYFCVPCKPTKANGGRTRNLPCHALEKWELFKTYCKRDVDVEKSIRRKLHNFPIPESEMELYRLDQRINDRGVLVDMGLVEQAIACERLHKEVVTKRAYELTGLENPNSVAQLKGWLGDMGMEAESLSKKAVAEMIAETDGEVEELLRLRLLMAKTSVKKYEAMERSVCSDGRIHGMLMFYGANRSGRWSGKNVQIQNLPKNDIPDLELARDLVKQGRFEDIELLYDSTPNVLSELIRTAFIPKLGCRFVVADFSAIEARVMGWLSGEEWVLDVFRGDGKLYEMTASRMFGIPMAEIGKGSPERAKGKVASLSCQYGGSTNGLISMGALDMGLTEEELPPLVAAWRKANPHMVQFWWDVDAAAIKAVTEKQKTKVGKIIFEYMSGILFITLPSGRKLSYVKPRMAVNRFGRDGLTYEGIAENKKWSRIETYGPKLVENIVQGTARDLLAEAMLRVEKKGYPIVMHCHDEIIAEVPEGSGSVDEMCEIMAIQPKWAEGLPLRADGYQCSFYQKM